MKLKRALSCVLFAAVILIVFEATNANDEKKKSSASNGRRRNRNNEIENQRVTSFSDDQFVEQKPVKEDPMWLQNIRQKSSNKSRGAYKPTMKPPPFPFQRETSRPNGKPCKFNADCVSGCCKINERTKRRRCSALARNGQKCESSQVKGGAYLGYCPCVSGYSACEYNAKKKRNFGVCSA